ncbi:MAG: hypothetical protein ACD_14C00011G0001 [uncultured bacterium]|nr:MAG: hypothetical protein ACD_14C00011G0001 [uncultured bacterium]KKQ43979.1 MAG: Membrane-associated protein, SNARE-like protein [Candidatus Moranbacteria bacterium GW2011_GWC2_37_8]KKQ60402.1 MAG: hypothetical protein US82_C0036G0005 [Parcubacteria group bacterium GW2011_GWC1_38_22]
MINPGFNFNDFGALIDSVKSGSYMGIFLLSIILSYIVPLPEAVALLLFGFLGATTDLNIFVVFSIVFLGIVIGDNILYRLSYFGNAWVERFNLKMRKNKLIKYENLVVDNINKTIYFLRLVAGVRFFGPVIAGTLGVSWRNFFIANFGATLINTAFFIALGYYFHGKIVPLIAEVEIARNMLLFSSAVIVGFLLNVFRKKV